MQFQLQFITDELPQTPVHINQRTAVRGVIHYQNKILMVQTNRGDYKFPGGGMEEGETEKKHCFGRSRRRQGTRISTSG